MQSMVERFPGVAPPIRKSNPDSYADTPFAYQIILIEMPMKFSFPSIKEYDGPSDSDDHVTQYMQRMLAVALPKESREAIMCKGFGSILTGPALQWYINLPSRSISSFAIPSDKFVEQFASSRDLEKTYDEKVAITGCNIPTAIFAFKRGLLPDGDLSNELTKYQCKSMEDVLSRAWAQVKWEEDVASRAKAQLKQDPKAVRPDRSERDERPSPRPTRQMGQQFMWPQKMKAPDSFRNLSLWCDIHRDHGHRTEDCVALKIEVNELLKKGHLSEFLSGKAKTHLRRETTGKPTEAAPVLPPRQKRVIHVISGSSEISDISHAATKKSTWNDKHSLEAAKPKRLLLGSDEIKLFLMHVF
ncbi:hypothetical protein F2Q69_00006559 [Brassica cretica]|uniref:Retrotransposon gag domain-containing protein n=1 Tax=Brassica cretica TaxID=69181 RepID=A0A8S9PHT3_BRACR|nr:hypothetical protein F2Q69_00006559 [Brassica cretica]